MQRANLILAGMLAALGLGLPAGWSRGASAVCLRLLDRFRTTVSVGADHVGAVVIAQLSGAGPESEASAA